MQPSTNPKDSKTTDKKEETKYSGLSNSYRFPSHTLEHCLEKIKILFEANTRKKMTLEGMAADLSISSGSGSTGLLFAALKYYDLLEKDQDYFRIPEFLVDYCSDNKLTEDIVFRSLMSVPINKHIFAEFDIKDTPNENQIKSFLIKKANYDQRQVTKYMEIFNKNMVLYKSILNPSQQSFNDSIQMQPTLGLPYTSNTNQEITSEVHSISQQPVISNQGLDVITYPLSDGNQLTIYLPKNIRDLDQEALEDIQGILNLVLHKIEKRLNSLGVSNA